MSDSSQPELPRPAPRHWAVLLGDKSNEPPAYLWEFDDNRPMTVEEFRATKECHQNEHWLRAEESILQFEAVDFYTAHSDRYKKRVERDGYLKGLRMAKTQAEMYQGKHTLDLEQEKHLRECEGLCKSMFTESIAIEETIKERMAKINGLADTFLQATNHGSLHSGICHHVLHSLRDAEQLGVMEEIALSGSYPRSLRSLRDACDRILQAMEPYYSEVGGLDGKGTRTSGSSA